MLPLAFQIVGDSFPESAEVEIVERIIALEEEGEIHEIVKRLLIRVELDKDVDITLGALLVPHEGPEESKPRDPEGSLEVSQSDGQKLPH